MDGSMMPGGVEPLELPPGIAGAEGPPADPGWGQIAMVPVAALAVDRGYQRSVSDRGRRLIRAMVADFDPAVFGVLLGHWAGARFALIDGQHRALAALALGLRVVPCLSVQPGSAAAVFLTVNRDSVALRPLDRWRAAVAAGEPAAVALAGICEGLELEPVHAVPKPHRGGEGGWVPGTRLGCVGKAWRLCAQADRAVVEAALGCLQDAERECQSVLLTSQMLVATVEVVAAIFRETEEVGGPLDALATALAEHDAEDWAGLARARDGRATARGLAELIDAARLRAEEGADA